MSKIDTLTHLNHYWYINFFGFSKTKNPQNKFIYNILLFRQHYSVKKITKNISKLLHLHTKKATKKFGDNFKNCLNLNYPL